MSDLIDLAEGNCPWTLCDFDAVRDKWIPKHLGDGDFTIAQLRAASDLSERNDIVNYFLECVGKWWDDEYQTRDDFVSWLDRYSWTSYPTHQGHQALWQSETGDHKKWLNKQWRKHEQWNKGGA